MSFDQLRYFVAVAEEASVSRAARRLNISQPPLTRHIRSLEDELGTSLFERGPTGMRLLPPGEALVARAREILAAVDAAKLDVQACAPPPGARGGPDVGRRGLGGGSG
jgi:DNA-binding transcriptional LysR family regulator